MAMSSIIIVICYPSWISAHRPTQTIQNNISMNKHLPLFLPLQVAVGMLLAFCFRHVGLQGRKTETWTIDTSVNSVDNMEQSEQHIQQQLLVNKNKAENKYNRLKQQVPEKSLVSTNSKRHSISQMHSIPDLKEDNVPSARTFNSPVHQQGKVC